MATSLLRRRAPQPRARRRHVAARARRRVRRPRSGRRRSTTASATASDLASRSLFDAKWERRTQRGLSYTWQFTRAGRATTGRSSGSCRGATSRPRTSSATGSSSPTSTATSSASIPGALAFSTFRNADRALESGQYAFWVQWDTKAGGGGWIEPKWFHENVLAPFTIGNAVHDPRRQLRLRRPAARLHHADRREAADRRRLPRPAPTSTARRTQVILTPTWNVSTAPRARRRLPADRCCASPARDQSANIHLLRLRDPHRARRAGVGQRVRAVQLDDRPARLQRAPALRVAEGTDLWLVYNEGLDTDRTLDTVTRPIVPLSVSRALILKYTHTFSF